MQNIITGNESNYVGEIAVKSIFRSKEELRFKLSVLAIKLNFEFKVKKSTKTLYTVGCTEQGYKWVCVRRVSEVVTHRQARSSVVGQLVKSNLEDVSRQYRLKDIINDMQKNYGMNIRYEKAWGAKNVALNLLMGSPKHSYTLLRKYGEALKAVNVGTVFEVELEEDKYFKYAFMALGCCIRGFSSCIRPVLVIDGAHFKGKYRGVILIASSVDGNNQIYPLAFGIVDQESGQSWTWFLNMVKTCIGEVDELLFVSDRHVCITKSVRQVFPQAAHGICMQHLSMNLKDKFKDDVYQPVPLFILTTSKSSKSIAMVQKCIQLYTIKKWSYNNNNNVELYKTYFITITKVLFK
ncbi:protein FAR-RED ELONGATED HYPOCOTYL 3-like [Momordica charantia]|uniref:Protein FAR-RED ELONGATED HYPOCOTYL 3-like n=1 Tax=Momordica charantia TaxID=3673 RepID=A0A6J1DLK7_MOMCH|nr:protein FAR-RED ELONGATED HYPOCOTYL 3-like [Momordica charantia]